VSIQGRKPADVPIGWIGTGVMGASMCGHLMDAGHPATVHTRTRAKAEGLLSRGAAWADSPRQVAEPSDVIFTIVGYPADVREVILGDHLSRQSNLARCLMAGSPPVVKCEPRCFSCSGPAGEPCEFAVAARCRGPIVNAV